ncbi:potassium/sodium hyperpolarization-activated cyclic nucleotide-gated channel 2 isoform X19 [Tribolium castaneum]|uniref:potassium/sodium hyperpolarization-activated cyclic nucleotide-gated channel 2 isoform X19 n=1 Tax=Tribolium castaneum TaxID=7070 RepID=UPI00077DDC91|nr:PREDICTED: potassium/sodium hyperpolarization-activated cyclic nucleotide-gated channel 2 isoform X16 [Tribolium castaneum]|eukprot:XP_015837534.1 PREDICTED: potassium/sodium hyperpolarization-activated cyclic nucleotide-gated channel 2 isoform X16 [Tribolium castaneum]
MLVSSDLCLSGASIAGCQDPGDMCSTSTTKTERKLCLSQRLGQQNSRSYGETSPLHTKDGGGDGGERRGGARRVPSLRLANGRVAAAQSEEEIRSPPPRRLAKDDSIKISIENTNTCTDSLVTALDDETLLIADYLSNDMNYKGSGKVHFGVDDVSLYGTPKEEPGPTPLGSAEAGKQSFIKNQLQALFQPTDNKLAMKLFGSKKALMKERIRQKAAGHWVIHPCSSFRFYWDLCMLLLLVANLIILPVAISFFNDDLSTRWIAFNCLSDTIFLIDIVVNFRTGIMQQDNAEQVILDPKLIAKHYLRTWFFLDLISSIPLDYIFLIFNQFQDYGDSFQILHAGRALRILRLAKLLSLVRLLRLSRLVRYVSQWEEVYSFFWNLVCHAFLYYLVFFAFSRSCRISKKSERNEGGASVRTSTSLITPKAISSLSF